jgi:hypothetical protein
LYPIAPFYTLRKFNFFIFYLKNLRKITRNCTLKNLLYAITRNPAQSKKITRNYAKIEISRGLIWSAKTLAGFISRLKILAGFISRLKILAGFISRLKILAGFISRLKILAGFISRLKILAG